MSRFWKRRRALKFSWKWRSQSAAYSIQRAATEFGSAFFCARDIFPSFFQKNPEMSKNDGLLPLRTLRLITRTLLSRPSPPPRFSPSCFPFDRRNPPLLATDRKHTCATCERKRVSQTWREGRERGRDCKQVCQQVATDGCCRSFRHIITHRTVKTLFPLFLSLSTTVVELWIRPGVGSPTSPEKELKFDTVSSRRGKESQRLPSQ